MKYKMLDIKKESRNSKEKFPLKLYKNKGKYIIFAIFRMSQSMPKVK